MAGKQNLWNDLPMAVLGLFASHGRVVVSIYIYISNMYECITAYIRALCWGDPNSFESDTPVLYLL